MDAQEAEDQQFISEIRQEAASYRRQWILWLGIGGAGGMVALLSFAAALPDPDYALRVLWPSLAAFAASILTAGLSLLLSSLQSHALAEHYASGSNRDRLNAKIRGMVQMISSSPRVADQFNAPRQKAIEQSREFHALAESAWSRRTLWSIIRRTCLVVSSLSFLLGTAYPLFLIGSGAEVVRNSGSQRGSAT